MNSAIYAIWGIFPRWGLAATAAAGLAVGLLWPRSAWAQRPSTDGHVAELARYLDRVQIAEPVRYRNLSVYPILVSDGYRLPGSWLSADDAISRGVLSVREKGEGGSVPRVIVENRSRDEHVFIMGGEVLSGGKQTRTVRRDVVLAPGQQIELDVYCVEAHRWSGDKDFSGAKVLVPQSIQQELRRDAGQDRVWAEVARNNAALQAENATGSLETALRHRDVAGKLSAVREAIVPRMPEGTLGYVFVDGRRALGAELFGSTYLAREALPKLLDSYAVDCVILRPGEHGRWDDPDDGTAIEFFRRVCRTGSHRTDTAGSGAGIRTRSGGLLGDGVSLSGDLVHYGVQTDERIVPLPPPRPPIIWPPERR